MTIAIYIDDSASGRTTLGDLKARIADELDRSDLTSQIALAIDDAINEASVDRFHFNEIRALPFETVAGTDHYVNENIGALRQIDAVYYRDGEQRRNLRPANILEMNCWSEGNPSLGEPTHNARQGQALRLWPIPRQDWVIYIDGVTRMPALATDSQYDGWTNDGERLIRAIAKRNLLLDLLHDPDGAQVQEMLVQRHRGELLARAYDHAASGKVTAHG